MKSAVVDVGSPGFGAEILTSSVGNKNQACFNAYSHFWWLYEIEKSNRCYIQNSGNKKVSTCCAEDEDFFDVKTKILVNLCLFWKLFEIVICKQKPSTAEQLTHSSSTVFHCWDFCVICSASTLCFDWEIRVKIGRFLWQCRQSPLFWQRTTAKSVWWDHQWRFGILGLLGSSSRIFVTANRFFRFVVVVSGSSKVHRLLCRFLKVFTDKI